MTTPYVSPDAGADEGPAFPKAMLSLGADTRKNFEIWLSDQVERLLSAHKEKEEQWAEEEATYNADPEPAKSFPFVGACNEVVPAAQMAVDPIVARLKTVIVKSGDTIFKLKSRDDIVRPHIDNLNKFVDYYLRSYIKFPKAAAPRLLELAKHGSCVFRVEYEDDTREVQTQRRTPTGWETFKRRITRCKGPKITGVPIQNFVFPPRYQHLQDCPIVLERTWLSLAEVEAQVKLGQMVMPEHFGSTDTSERTLLDQAQEDSARHHEVRRTEGEYELFRFCCRYDINGDGYEEMLFGVWDQASQSLLQLRHNWYWHQRYPYVVVPYMQATGSLYGVGLCKKILPFQKSMTSWYQNIWNNGYLANIRQRVKKKEGNRTEDPDPWIPGKTDYVDNPKEDVNYFAVSDIYNSGFQMLQMLVGWLEKITGVSDYLTGRESPVVGSRATATSTVALIQEGTKRVEDTLDNIRDGFSELMEMCFYIWIQYGTNGLEDLVFDEEVAASVKTFFDNATELDVGSALSIDLAATDASNNKTVKQQLQLALIQTFMQFYTQLLQAAQLAMSASQQGMTPLSELVGEVMQDAKRLYHDLATAYDVANPDDYLPELERFIETLGAIAGPGPQAGGTGGFGGPPTGQGVPTPGGGVPVPPGAIPQAGGGGNGSYGGVPSLT